MGVNVNILCRCCVREWDMKKNILNPETDLRDWSISGYLGIPGVPVTNHDCQGYWDDRTAQKEPTNGQGKETQVGHRIEQGVRNSSLQSDIELNNKYNMGYFNLIQKPGVWLFGVIMSSRVGRYLSWTSSRAIPDEAPSSLETFCPHSSQIYTTGKRYGIFFITAIFGIFDECEWCFCTWNTFPRADITFGGVNFHLTAKWNAKVQKQLFRYFSQLDFG